MRILVNTPRLIPHGGVANHYIGLKDYWKEIVIYNPIGKKGSKPGSGIYRLPLNMVTFIAKIMRFNPDVILLNPSLSKSAMARDMIFLKIAKMLGRKVVIFIHGFNKNNIPNLNVKTITNNLNKCEGILVLADDFANILRAWGVTVPIFLTTTKVDDKLISKFDIKAKEHKIKTILYLARVTEEKGIFISLETFNILQNKYPNLKFKVVGDGPDLNEAKRFAVTNNITNIEFKGALSGDELIKEFATSDLYLFTSYHEGMPTSVLEAMAFGLPIVSRPVGGLCDFFEDGKMGYLVDSYNAVDFVTPIEKLMGDIGAVEKISLYNHEFAKKNFLASSVARNLESLLKKII